MSTPQSTTVDKATANKIITRYRQQPEAYVKEILGGTPWSKQTEILHSVRDNRRTSVRSCHSSGKTYIAASAVLWFLFCNPNSVVVSTAPTFFQVRNLLWREINSAHRKSKYPLGGKCLDTQLSIDDKWFAVGLSTDTPDRFQGFHSETGRILLVVDEASGVEEDIFQASEGLLTSENARLLLLGNPIRNSGTFYDSFRDASYNAIHISYKDTPNFTNEASMPFLITPTWVEERRRAWGEGSPLWDSRVEGNFPKQGSDTLIGLEDIELAQRRYTEVAVDTSQPIRLGIDVARFGQDSTEIFQSQGMHASSYKTVRHFDTMAVAGETIAALTALGAEHANIDEAGLGAGTLDRLKEQGKPVTGINNASSAISDQDGTYLNIRAQSYCLLRDEFRAGTIAIDPNDAELEAQLADIKYKFTSSGKLQIEEKADYKKRHNGQSPDKLDALVLARFKVPPTDYTFFFPHLSK